MVNCGDLQILVGFFFFPAMNLFPAFSVLGMKEKTVCQAFCHWGSQGQPPDAGEIQENCSLGNQYIANYLTVQGNPPLDHPQ